MINIRNQIQLVSTFTIKLHVIAVAMNSYIRKLGLDPIDEYSDEDLLRLGIRKFEYSNEVANILLSKDEMAEEDYNTIINSTVGNLTEPIPTRKLDYDLLSWRYYKNLMGEYHKVDYELLKVNGYLDLYPEANKIIIKDKFTNDTFELTKDNLKIRPLTHKELRKFDSYYDSIVEQYPDFEILIRGIINPTLDVNKLLHSESGTILQYSDIFVGYNELDLIPNTSYSCINYLKRWNVKEYSLAFDLYPAALYGNLIQFCLYSIYNFRLDKIGTNQVSEFHMNMHFSSNLDIASEASILSNDVRMWLYKNIKYLINNVGKVDNLQLIIDNIIDPSVYGLDKVIRRTPNLKLNVDYNDHTQRLMDVNNKILHNVNYGNRNTSDSTSTIIGIQAEQLVELDNSEYSIDDDSLMRERTVIENDITGNVDTKVMRLFLKNNTNHHLITESDVYVDTLFDVILSTDIANKHIDISVDSLHTSIELSYRDCLILYMYAVLKQVNKEDMLIDTYTTNTLITDEIDRDMVYKNLYLKPYDRQVFEEYILRLEAIPKATDIKSSIERSDSIVKWNFEVNGLIATVPKYVSGFYKVALSRLKVVKKIKIYDTPTNISYYTNKYLQPDVNTDNSIINLGYDIIEAVVGKTVYTNRQLVKEADIYKSLINKLTSYTTMIIKDGIGDVLSGEPSSIGSLHGMDLSYINKSSFRCYELFPGVLDTSLSDEIDSLLHAISKTDKIEIIEDPILHQAIYDGGDIVNIKHGLIVEVNDE